MRILINASNLKVGGGLQVADSVCRELHKYPQHQFVAVLAPELKQCGEEIAAANVEVVNYLCPVSAKVMLTGRDATLDALVESRKIDAVLTIFGPSRWQPRVTHLCGFARAQLVLQDSPYYTRMGFAERLKTKAILRVYKHFFDKSGDNLYTENEFISERLRRLFPKKQVFTVTNNYNQVFDQRERWQTDINLPTFDGLTLLTVTANYPHKNVGIILPAIDYLAKTHPDAAYRFVLTLPPDCLGELTEEQRRHIVFLGPVAIEQVPHLYEQSDVMFLPTLLECFSASYAEAMKMGRPILTTDLGFARSLCGDAALYYSPVDAEDLGEKIVRIAGNAALRQDLIEKGKEQLQKYDTFAERARKLIEILEKIK